MKYRFNYIFGPILTQAPYNPLLITEKVLLRRRNSLNRAKPQCDNILFVTALRRFSTSCKLKMSSVKPATITELTIERSINADVWDVQNTFSLLWQYHRGKYSLHGRLELVDEVYNQSAFFFRMKLMNNPLLVNYSSRTWTDTEALGLVWLHGKSFQPKNAFRPRGK